MKKIFFLLTICLSTYCLAQTPLKALDVFYLQDKNLGSGDLGNLNYFVKMFNPEEPYNILPDGFSINLSGNKVLKNLSSVKYVDNTFRPATRCYITIDLGDNNPVNFWYFANHTKPYDTQFTTQMGGIMLKLFIEEK